jgi:dGTPase
MINPDMLAGVKLWDLLIENVGWSGPALTDLDRHRLIRRLIGILVTDVVKATSERIDASGAKSPLDIQKLDHVVIGYSEEMDAKNKELKNFLFANLYQHPDVLKMADNAEHVLTEIFNAYLADPSLMPAHYQAVIDQRGLKRTIADYIAGMTDRFAQKEMHRVAQTAEEA